MATNQKVGGSSPSWRATSRRTLVVRRIFLRKMRLHRTGCRSSPRKVTLGSAARLQAPSLTPRCRYQLFAVEGHCSLGIYFVTLTHVAANPCGSPHFSAQNAASPFGLPLLPAKSLAAPALFACKRAHDVPACYQLFADFPTFPQPGTGGARCPTCSFFSSLLPSDPYLTHTVFPWVWVKLWSGYHRIPAPGIFLMAPSAPAPRPSSWLPPAGRWW